MPSYPLAPDVTYDYAGRVTNQAIPLSGNITQTYDARGNVKSLTDADGFVTQYTYGAFNRLTQEFKPKRAGNATDEAAFSVVGFGNSYVYDTAGNLTKKMEKGLITDYEYNSMGKVQKETRPYKAGVVPTYKWHAYRLDGEKVLESNYGYDDSATRGNFTTVANHGSTTQAPNTVTAGNLKIYDLSKTGKRTREISRGVGSNGVARVNESDMSSLFNGLGLRYKRDFVGANDVYAQFYEIVGRTNGTANHAQFWKYDGNSNLLKSYKLATDVATGTITSGFETDVFEYAYSSTNKEILRKSNARQTVASARDPAGTKFVVSSTISETANSDKRLYTGPAPITIQTSTTLTYSNADRLTDVTTKDTDVWGTSTVRTSRYAYYKSGQRESVTVWKSIDVNTPSAKQTFSYDQRGRLISQVDANGEVDINGTSTNGSVTTTTTYSPEKIVVSLSNGKYSKETWNTIGGLEAKTIENMASEVKFCPKAYPDGTIGNPSCTMEVQNTYTSGGVLDKSTPRMTSKFGYVYGAFSIASTFKYDNYGNPTEIGLAKINTYDTNNNLTKEETLAVQSLGTTAKIINYTLDSQGNRIYSSENGSQYLDAENRVVETRNVIYEGFSYNWAPYPPRYTVKARTFTYDPRGDLVMSGSIRIVEIAGTDKDGRVNPTEMLRKSQTSVFIEGQAQFVHQVNSVRGNRLANDPFNWWAYPVNSTTNLDFDETFSLADSIRWDGKDEWNTYVVASAPEQPSQALEAPVAPLSTQIGITTASSVTSPSASSNVPSAPASNVTIPSNSNAETPVANQIPATTPNTPATNSVSSPATGISAQAASAATNTATSPTSSSVSSPSVGTTTQSQANVPTSNTNLAFTTNPSTGVITTTPLQAPSQAAPSGIAVTASSVSSPNSVPNAPTTTASSVTSPNASSSISTPSISSVTSPSSTNTPSSVSNVTPPVSSVKPTTGTINPFGYYNIKTGMCDPFPTSTAQFTCDTTSDLNQQLNSFEQQARVQTGEKAARARLEAARIRAQLEIRRAVGNDRIADGYVGRLEQSNLYQSLDGNPVGKTMFWLGITGQLQANEGKKYGMTPKAFTELIVRSAETTRLTRDASGKRVLLTVPSNYGGSNTGGGLSLNAGKANPVTVGFAVFGSATRTVSGVEFANYVITGILAVGGIVFSTRADLEDELRTAVGSRTAESSPDPNDPCKDWQKKVDSLRKRANEHIQKRNEYSNDPFKFDNLGYLANNPNPAIQQKIISSRIAHLQQEIDAFNDQADALERNCK